MHLHFRDRRKILEKVGNRVAAIQLIEQRLDRHTRPGEAWRSAHDLRINDDDTAFHDRKATSKTSSVQDREGELLCDLCSFVAKTCLVLQTELATRDHKELKAFCRRGEGTPPTF
jgi:hypothetical protein